MGRLVWKQECGRSDFTISISDMLGEALKDVEFMVRLGQIQDRCLNIPIGILLIFSTPLIPEDSSSKS